MCSHTKASPKQTVWGIRGTLSTSYPNWIESQISCIINRYKPKLTVVLRYVFYVRLLIIPL